KLALMPSPQEPPVDAIVNLSSARAQAARPASAATMADAASACRTPPREVPWLIPSSSRTAGGGASRAHATMSSQVLRQEQDGTGSAAPFEIAMGVGGRCQWIAVPNLHPDQARAKGREGLLRDLVERGPFRGVVEQHGAAQRERLCRQALR